MVLIAPTEVSFIRKTALPRDRGDTLGCTGEQDLRQPQPVRGDVLHGCHTHRTLEHTAKMVLADIAHRRQFIQRNVLTVCRMDVPDGGIDDGIAADIFIADAVGALRRKIFPQ